MKENVVLKNKVIRLKKEEQDQLRRELSMARAETHAKKEEEPKIIRKTDLKNHRFMVIEHRQGPEGWRPVAVGLMRTRVNKEEKTMTGIRILVCCGKSEFWEYTYNMDQYRKNWRAWTKMPQTIQPWKQ